LPTQWKRSYFGAKRRNVAQQPRRNRDIGRLVTTAGVCVFAHSAMEGLQLGVGAA
jgi:hypothetical protein